MHDKRPRTLWLASAAARAVDPGRPDVGGGEGRHAGQLVLVPGSCAHGRSSAVRSPTGGGQAERESGQPGDTGERLKETAHAQISLRLATLQKAASPGPHNHTADKCT